MPKKGLHIHNLYANKTTIIFLSLLFFLMTSFSTNFITEQKKFERVRKAYTEKETLLTERLKNLNLNLNNIHVLITAFKQEQELDLYVKSKNDVNYKKITTYAICASSGRLGPKRKQGDYQVPEGFYHIDRFNPASNYYLSLGINYPNQSDKIKSTAPNLGGDIFIHGECVTIGCLPMTNDKIKEIYIYAIQAKQNGQLKIPVYIFPFRFTKENTLAFQNQYKSSEALLKFWNNLKSGYEKFHNDFQELKITINKNGDYLF